MLRNNLNKNSNMIITQNEVVDMRIDDNIIIIFLNSKNQKKNQKKE